MNNALEIYKNLEKTNCGKCGCPTCLAFAAAVFKKDRKILDCPFVDKQLAERFEAQRVDPVNLETEQQRILEKLKEKVASIDLMSSAERLRARPVKDGLAIGMLGRDFRVDHKGNVASDCHVHGWVTIPLLNYVIHCKGTELSGKWVPFRELPKGASWNALYLQRCEKPLKRIADNQTDLFETMIEIFRGKEVDSAFDSDISLVLHPLPRIPILICYWKPEDGMESTINILFDAVSTDNLNIEALYTLTGGLVNMFEKIRDTHVG